MAEIKYYSTNLNAQKIRFQDALIKGQAPDKGLYMPEVIPVFSKDELSSLRGKPYPDIALKVVNKFLSTEITPDDLKAIVDDAYTFPVPLEKVFDRHYIMRLDQGPTASFKDFAARLMGRLMQYYLKAENKKMLILTATSGDTGSAIANAFYGLNNIDVVILFPMAEVTDRQRKQMTTLGKNIKIVGIEGKFDDCQAMVKQAFSDEELSHLPLSSANSINIGRLIPQSIYYFYAWAQLSGSVDEQIIFSVPSGNFGNLMGGIIAKHMGLPVKKFVVSTNDNDEVPVYLQTNIYKTIVPSKNCISSAMNVGHPSNMARIIALYGGQMDEKGNILKEPDTKRLKNDLWGEAVSDCDTRQTIRTAYKDYHVLLEPHGAVGWTGLARYLENHQEDNQSLTITLETAHPAKFPAEINQLLGFDPKLTESLKGLDDLKENYLKIKGMYTEFKNLLLEKYSK